MQTNRERYTVGIPVPASLIQYYILFSRKYAEDHTPLTSSMSKLNRMKFL